MNIQIKTNILGSAVGTISVSCILNYYYKLLIDYFTPYPHQIPKKTTKNTKKTHTKTPQKNSQPHKNTPTNKTNNNDNNIIGRKEMFYLTTNSTHFSYGYMASDIWLRTILIVRKETCCRHIGYSFRLTARVILYAPSHRQDSTYHGLCYTSRGTLGRTRNSNIYLNIQFC